MVFVKYYHLTGLSNTIRKCRLQWFGHFGPNAVCRVLDNANCNGLENSDCCGLDIFNAWTTTESIRDFTSGHQPMGNVDLAS